MRLKNTILCKTLLAAIPLPPFFKNQYLQVNQRTVAEQSQYGFLYINFQIPCQSPPQEKGASQGSGMYLGGVFLTMNLLD